MGGFEAEEGDLPWAVSIHAIYGGIDEAICSGTLISKRHVISAAHCFFKYEATTDKTGKCISYIHDAIPEEEVGKYYAAYIGSICTKGDNTKGECKSNRQQRRFFIKKAKYSEYFHSQCIGGSDFALLELEEDVPASIANHI
uniref:Peptidase S1 domain-containing protein n=1 Tax=Meloidogyne floridensis TaxID=298350 RepID=A0A915NGJ0_9BILA